MMGTRRPMTRTPSGNGRLYDSHGSSNGSTSDSEDSNGSVYSPRADSRSYLLSVRPENSRSSFSRYARYTPGRSTFCNIISQLTEETQPSFETTLKARAVSEGSDAKFICMVTGYPEPEVTWYKDDEEMDRYCGLPKYEILRSGKRHTLQIYKCSEEDAAIYQASARNNKGIVSCSGVLEVGTMSEYQIHQRWFAKLKRKAEAKMRELEQSRRRVQENFEEGERLRALSPERIQRKRRFSSENKEDALASSDEKEVKVHIPDPTSRLQEEIPKTAEQPQNVVNGFAEMDTKPKEEVTTNGYALPENIEENGKDFLAYVYETVEVITKKQGSKESYAKKKKKEDEPPLPLPDSKKEEAKHGSPKKVEDVSPAPRRSRFSRDTSKSSVEEKMEVETPPVTTNKRFAPQTAPNKTGKTVVAKDTMKLKDGSVPHGRADAPSIPKPVNLQTKGGDIRFSLKEMYFDDSPQPTKEENSPPALLRDHKSKGDMPSPSVTHAKPSTEGQSKETPKAAPRRSKEQRDLSAGRKTSPITSKKSEAPIHGRASNIGQALPEVKPKSEPPKLASAERNTGLPAPVPVSHITEPKVKDVISPDQVLPVRLPDKGTSEGTSAQGNKNTCTNIEEAGRKPQEEPPLENYKMPSVDPNEETARTETLQKLQNLEVEYMALQKAYALLQQQLEISQKAEEVNAEAQRAEAMKAEAQRAETQKAEVQKAEEIKADAQRAETQKAETQKAEVQKAEAQRAEVQKAEAQRAEVQKEEAQRAEAQKTEAIKLGAMKVEAKKAAAQKAEARRAELMKAETQKTGSQRAESQKAEAQRAELMMAEAQRIELMKVQRAEAQRAEAQKVEAQRAEEQKAETQKAEAKMKEAQRAGLMKAEAQRPEAQKAEAQREESKKSVAHREEAMKARAKKAEAQKAEAQRADVQKAEALKAVAQKAEVQRAEVFKSEAQRAKLMKAETQQTDVQRAEVQKADLMKAEAQKANSVRAEAQKAEARAAKRAELVNTEAQSVEAQKAEAAKSEVQRAEVQKEQAQRAELMKAEVQSTKAQKAEAQKSEAMKADGKSAEAQKAELMKAESQKKEAQRPASQKAEAWSAEMQKAKAERAEVQRAKAQKIDAQRAELMKFKEQTVEATKAEAQTLVAIGAEAQRAKLIKVEVQKTEAQRTETKKGEAEKAEAQKEELIKAETQKAEAQRTEAQKSEAHRTEAKKEEAKMSELMEAEAQITEAQKSEAQRTEAKKKETQMAELMTAESQRAKTMKAEAQKVESLKAEGKRAEAIEAEAQRTELMNAETQKTKAQRAETLKAEVWRAEVPKAKTQITEAPMAEAQKVEAQRVEVQKVEAQGAELMKVKAQKAEATKLETQSAKTMKAEKRRAVAIGAELMKVRAQKAEARRAETQKAEGQRAETQKAEAKNAQAQRSEAKKEETQRVELIKAQRVEAQRVVAQRAESQRVKTMKAEAKRVELKKAEPQRADAEKAVAQKAEAEKAVAQRADTEKAVAQRAAAEKAVAQRAEAEKAVAQRAEAEKAVAQRAEAKKAVAQGAEAEKAVAQRAEAEKAVAQRAEAEKAVAQRAEAEKVVAQRAEAEKAVAQREELMKTKAQKAEAKRIEAQNAEAQNAEERKEEAQKAEEQRPEAQKPKAQKTEAHNLEAMKAEAQRAEAPKAEAHKAETQTTEAQKAEEQKAMKAETRSAESIRAELTKSEAQKAEAQRAEAQRSETQRAEAQRSETQRAEAKKKEAQRAELTKAEAQRVEAQKAESQKTEAQRAEAQKAEAQRAGTMKAEAQRAELMKENAQKAESQRAETQKAESQRAAAQKAESQGSESQRAEEMKEETQRENEMKAEAQVAEAMEVETQKAKAQTTQSEKAKAQNADTQEVHGSSEYMGTPVLNLTESTEKKVPRSEENMEEKVPSSPEPTPMETEEFAKAQEEQQKGHAGVACQQKDIKGNMQSEPDVSFMEKRIVGSDDGSLCVSEKSIGIIGSSEVEMAEEEDEKLTPHQFDVSHSNINESIMEGTGGSLTRTATEQANKTVGEAELPSMSEVPSELPTVAETAGNIQDASSVPRDPNQSVVTLLRDVKKALDAGLNVKDKCSVDPIPLQAPLNLGQAEERYKADSMPTLPENVRRDEESKPSVTKSPTSKEKVPKTDLPSSDALSLHPVLENVQENVPKHQDKQDHSLVTTLKNSLLMLFHMKPADTEDHNAKTRNPAEVREESSADMYSPERSPPSSRKVYESGKESDSPQSPESMHSISTSGKLTPSSEEDMVHSADSLTTSPTIPRRIIDFSRKGEIAQVESAPQSPAIPKRSSKVIGDETLLTKEDLSFSPSTSRKIAAKIASGSNSVATLSVPSIVVGSLPSEKTSLDILYESQRDSNRKWRSSENLSAIPSATPQELASGARRKIYLAKPQQLEGENDGNLVSVTPPSKKGSPNVSPGMSRKSSSLLVTQSPPVEKRSPGATRRMAMLEVPKICEETVDSIKASDSQESKDSGKEEPQTVEIKKVNDPYKAPQVIRKIRAEQFSDASGNLKLWCQFFNILNDSDITWYKDEVQMAKVKRCSGDEGQVALAIVQASVKDCGVYQCTIENDYGTDSTDCLLSAEVLDGFISREEVEVGEEIEMTPMVFAKGLADSGYWGDKFFGRIVMEEPHAGKGFLRKSCRVKVIYGLEPIFESGKTCILKIRNLITFGSKNENTLVEKNYEITIQECKIQSTTREYCKIFATECRGVPNFGQILEILPLNLIYRPANNIPYATIEEDLVGRFEKYCVRDITGKLHFKNSTEIEQKCCTFQHWVYQWTNGNFLVTTLEGVGWKLTNIAIATKTKGYQGLKESCHPEILEEFPSIHQCNGYCEMLSLKSLKTVESLQPPNKPKGSRSPQMPRKSGSGSSQSSPQIQKKTLTTPQNNKKGGVSPKSTRKAMEAGELQPGAKNKGTDVKLQ